jgi:hypothetical protein
MSDLILLPNSGNELPPKQWFDYPPSHFMHQYLRGRAGLNVGLDNGLTGLNKYLYGVHPGRYYLIGADSGVGKTTFADFGFVLNALAGAEKAGKKLYIFYYSFEISKQAKIAKWISYFLYWKYKVRLPSEYIMGRIDGMIVSDDHDKLIQEVYPIVEKIMERIVFVEDPIHPTFIYHSLVDNHYANRGTILREAQTEKQKAENRPGRIIGYVANQTEADSQTIILIDHIALTAPEKGMNTKDVIDRLSSYFVQLRNMFGATIVVVQQFNSDLQTFNRQTHLRKQGAGIILPQKLDFGDSKYTFRDADVVIGLVNPAKFDLEKFFTIDLKLFKSYYICAMLMKNRYGTDNKMISYFMDPVSGTFEYIQGVEGNDINPFLEQIYSPKVNELEECQKLFYPRNR